MSTPASQINICSGVRLDPRYDHTIYFDTRQAQAEYFAGKVVKTFSAYSYLRKNWTLQVNATMQEASSWSYLYFRNATTTTPESKIYYYFITNIQYKNDGMVELTLELDVLQTYLFDMELLQCYVERQHTPSDEIGEHTVEEDLKTGELVDNSVTDWSSLENLCILVLATINPNEASTDKPVQALASMYDGVFSGLKVWAVDSTDWAEWSNQIERLASAGFLDGIVSMWMYPKVLVKLGGENVWGDDDLCKTVAGCKLAGSTFSVGSHPTELDGYTPKNKKLLTYPYVMLYVSNNVGGSATYRYERFDQLGLSFACDGSLSPEGTVKMYPLGYNGSDYALDSTKCYEYGLTLGSFPACSWDADVYKLWLAQNQNQHAYQAITASTSILAGTGLALAGFTTGSVALGGAGAGAMVSGANQIFSHIAQDADMQIQPPQARGTFSSNINVTCNKQTFTFHKKSITAERARIIDDFFTMYGYRLNRVQVPNICARPAFTYVKTVGSKIKANICTDDLVKLESIFDHGVTFWTNGDKLGDYSQTNTPT